MKIQSHESRTIEGKRSKPTLGFVCSGLRHRGPKMLAKMPSNYLSDSETMDLGDTESGYGTASEDMPPEIALTKPHLLFLNRQLQFLEPPGEFSVPYPVPPSEAMWSEETSADDQIRYPEMVHHHSPQSISVNSLWPQWPGHFGYAVQTEYPSTTSGRFDFPGYPSPLCGDSRFG